MKKSITALFSVLFTFTYIPAGFSQSLIETNISTRLASADSLVLSGEVQTALSLYQSVSSETSYESDPANKVVANTRTGQCYIHMGKYIEARELLEKTYLEAQNKLSKDDLNFLRLKGVYSWALGYTGEIDRELELSFELLETYENLNGDFRLEMANINNTISINYHLRGDYTSELLFIRKALRLLFKLEGERSLTFEEKVKQANIFSSYSVASVSVGDFENALIYADRTIQFYETYFPEKRETAIPFMIKSRYYMDFKNDLDSSMLYINRAIDRLEMDLGDGFPGRGSPVWVNYNTYKAEILMESGEFSQALKVLGGITTEWDVSLGNPPSYHPGLINFFNAISQIYIHLDQRREAGLWASLGLKMIENSAQDNHLSMVDLLIVLRDISAENGQWPEALSYQQEMHVLFGYDFNANDMLRGEGLHLFERPVSVLIETGTFLTKYPAEFARHTNVQEKEVYERALAYFIKAIQQVDNRKRYLFEIGVDEGFKNDNLPLYERTLTLIYEMLQKEDRQDLKVKALWVIEMAKNTLLKKAVHQEHVFDTYLTKQQQKKRRDLRLKVFKTKEKLDHNNRISLEAHIKAKNEYLHYQSELLMNYSYQSHYESLSERDVEQMTNGDDSTLVFNYFLGDEFLFYCATKRDQVELFKKNDAQLLTDRINRFQTFSNAEELSTEVLDYQWLDSIGVELYEHMVSDALQCFPNSTDLKFIPHRSLNLLSMDVLRFDNDGELKYLIEKYPISYHYTQFSVERSKKTASQKKIAGFLACRKKESGWLGNQLGLKGAEREIAGIGQVFNGEIAEGFGKQEFVSCTDDFAVLHLAMHAQINHKQPENSGLIFCSEDTIEMLTLSEINALKFNTDMTVLSACNTAGGEVREGEGVRSIMRSFLQTGNKSVVASLWKIPDEKTTDIMIDFYRELSKNQSKSKALQQAKINYLKATPTYNGKSPFFWSSFVVYGNDGPLDAGLFEKTSLLSGLGYYSAVIVALIVLLTLFFFYRKARKS